jgi:flagellar motor protein MotB
MALQNELQALRSQLASAQARKPFERVDVPEGAGVEGPGISFGAALLFTPGSAKLKPGAAAVLDQMVDTLQTRYAGERIIIEGHTDNTPLLQTEKIWKFNMNLAYNRALAVFEHFLSRGIPESRMIVHAYSFNRPTNPATVNTDAGRAKNRRVVLLRTGETVSGGSATAMRTR